MVMKMNKIITLSIIFSIIIVSISFSFFMDAYITIYDPDWYGLMNFNKEIPDKKKIFLLGSSSAYAVSATHQALTRWQKDKIETTNKPNYLESIINAVQNLVTGVSTNYFG